MIPLILLASAKGEKRIDAIKTLLSQHAARRPASVLLEGLFGDETFELDQVTAHRLGFGCPCCIGLLPLEVALVRILRSERPEMIILAALPGAHTDQLEKALARRFSKELSVELHVS